MPVLDKKQNSFRIEDPLVTEKHREEEKEPTRKRIELLVHLTPFYDWRLESKKYPFEIEN